MTRHTKGPWKVSYDHPTVNITSYNGVLLAETKLPFIEQNLENAKLMAEAPRMLFALKALLSCYGTSNMNAVIDDAKEIIKDIENTNES